jgi:hypothetical protein
MDKISVVRRSANIKTFPDGQDVQTLVNSAAE